MTSTTSSSKPTTPLSPPSLPISSAPVSPAARSPPSPVRPAPGAWPSAPPTPASTTTPPSSSPTAPYSTRPGLTTSSSITSSSPTSVSHSSSSPACQRREQVKTLLLQGLSYRQIAKKLNVGYATVHAHVKTIYKQNALHSREELAKRERIALPAKPPLTPRQQTIAQLLLANLNYVQIAKQLSTTYHIVHHDAQSLYRHFKVHSRSELRQRLTSESAAPNPEDKADAAAARIASYLNSLA